METQHLTSGFQIKAVAEDGTFSGYASVFGVEDSYSDVVIKGAFTKTIARYESKGTFPKLLWQHKMDEPIGIYTKMFEDDIGLFVEGKLLLDVQRAKEAHTLMKAGALDGLSIGYDVKDFEIQGDSVRLLKELELFEVSIVTFPANEHSLISNVKKKLSDGEMPSVRDFEHMLTRDAGFSRSESNSIINDGFKSMLLKRDAVYVDQEIVESLDRLISIIKNEV